MKWGIWYADPLLDGGGWLGDDEGELVFDSTGDAEKYIENCPPEDRPFCYPRICEA